MNDMSTTLGSLLATGKGILAADESLPTIEKRFNAIHLASTEESRRDYREMLFTTPRLNESIGGVILFDETLRQKTKDGVSMPELLAKHGIVPGIKVDAGTMALPAFAGEKLTQGLDRLDKRLAEYRQLGARFTKWRAVIAIEGPLPTQTCIEANARMLALFAALSQQAGLVPIVEPEVLMDGSHTLARCEEVMTLTLKKVFEALFEHRVVPEQMLLKTGMVLSGADCPQQATLPEIVEGTLRCFRRAVPAAVPGIVFLSGGQSEVEATERLNAICAHVAGGSRDRATEVPWKITFSFGRALQDSSMKLWGGSQDKVPQAQAALHHRASCNGLAVQGHYSKQAETDK